MSHETRLSRAGRETAWPVARVGRPAADLPRALRPLERMHAGGAALLSVGEIVALVVGQGRSREGAARVAERLVRRHGLAGMAAMTAAEWRHVGGLGEAAAGRICAAFELGRRVHARRGETPERLTRPRQVYRQLEALRRARKEHLVGLYLDAQNALLHRETISIGSLNTTRTHPREILYPAVTHLALGFILAHNHPSGSLEPSPEDLEFTRAVSRAGELMGIELYDHLIIARDGYTSLRERGLL